MLAVRFGAAAIALCLGATPAAADALEGRLAPAAVLAASTDADWRRIPADQLLVIELETGSVIVALSPSLAARHVERVSALARVGYYDGAVFNRVIDGFVAQGGRPDAVAASDAERDGAAPLGPLKAEFDEPVDEAFPFYRLPDPDGYAPVVGYSDSLPTGRDPASGRAWHLHCAGAFAFGRETGRDTAISEFYIALQPQRYLDRNLSVLGRVIDGMTHLQALPRVTPSAVETDAATDAAPAGAPIIRMRLMSDLATPSRAAYEILDSGRAAFAEYAEARRNRPEAFFYHRPDHLDVCALPVPARRVDPLTEGARP